MQLKCTVSVLILISLLMLEFPATDKSANIFPLQNYASTCSDLVSWIQKCGTSRYSVLRCLLQPLLTWTSKIFFFLQITGDPQRDGDPVQIRSIPLTSLSMNFLFVSAEEKHGPQCHSSSAFFWVLQIDKPVSPL